MKSLHEIITRNLAISRKLENEARRSGDVEKADRIMEAIKEQMRVLENFESEGVAS